MNVNQITPLILFVFNFQITTQSSTPLIDSIKIRFFNFLYKTGDALRCFPVTVLNIPFTIVLRLQFKVIKSFFKQ
ncbi:hypothetical protein Hdeb2414_s0147g00813851 [Helianthus debilis subsp. tardiflorus]